MDFSLCNAKTNQKINKKKKVKGFFFVKQQEENLFLRGYFEILGKIFLLREKASLGREKKSAKHRCGEKDKSDVKK